ncbi:ATP-binding protein [Spirillospora sp. NPDC077959]
MARRWLAGVFQEWGLGDDYIGRTVVTELVTNVHRHTDTEFIPVRLLLENGHPVVEVEDRSDGLPLVHTEGGAEGGVEGGAEGDLAESGRGLLMMSLLVQAWGVRTLAGGGKVTWARLGE